MKNQLSESLYYIPSRLTLNLFILLFSFLPLNLKAKRLYRVRLINSLETFLAPTANINKAYENLHLLFSYFSSCQLLLLKTFYYNPELDLGLTDKE